MDGDHLSNATKHYNLTNVGLEDGDKDRALRELGHRLEMLQDATPFRVVEMALEIQAERMRVVEATQARDAAVNRLFDAYNAIRRHSEFIEELQKEREARGLERLSYPTTPAVPTDLEGTFGARIQELEALVDDFQQINQCLKDYGPFERKVLCDPPPHYEDEIHTATAAIQTEPLVVEVQAPEFFPTSLCESHPQLCEASTISSFASVLPLISRQLMNSKAPDVIDLIQSRNKMLASIPLPDNAPDMTLSPISLPPQVTLHEFLNTAPPPLRADLGNYRVFHSTTTNWSPDREEHGFMYTPMFKCTTNPRAVTAHRWNAVDVVGRMSKATECFYNNDGTWYYAGSYKSFMIDIISTKEWDQLSSETTSALIKETLGGRKNTTPQNNYETGQLYAAGALKIACVALQCVGFNLDIYHSISELATRFIQTKWKPVSLNSSVSMSPSAGSTSSGMIGTPSINSTSNSFSGLSPHGGIGHLTFGSGLLGHSSLLPPASSKMNSPLSSHAPSSGPCTPSMPASGISTPGISPIGSSIASGLASTGLVAGSPAWNVTASGLGKFGKTGTPGMVNLDSVNRLGLQLSNISLSPGGAGGMLQHHHSQHQQQMRAGYFASVQFPEVGNEDSDHPGAMVGSECTSGMTSGVAIGSGRNGDASKMTAGSLK